MSTSMHPWRASDRVASGKAPILPAPACPIATPKSLCRLQSTKPPRAKPPEPGSARLSRSHLGRARPSRAAQHGAPSHNAPTHEPLITAPLVKPPLALPHKALSHSGAASLEATSHALVEAPPGGSQGPSLRPSFRPSGPPVRPCRHALPKPATFSRPRRQSNQSPTPPRRRSRPQRVPCSYVSPPRDCKGLRQQGALPAAPLAAFSACLPRRSRSDSSQQGNIIPSLSGDRRGA